MAFFRIKKIKGNEYAYIVENKWKGKGSRQKVKGYLGRAYRLELKDDVDFLKHFGIGDTDSYINSNSSSKIIKDLIEWELFKFDAKKDGFSIDLDSIKIQKKKKNAALMVNDGIMCSLTLKNLLEFKPEDEQIDGYRLARAFVEAGIKVPQDIFVGIFSRLHNTKDNAGGDFTW